MCQGQRTCIDASALGRESTTTILNKTLKPGCIISTSPYSFASDTPGELSEIGEGFQGTIFEQSGQSSLVLKKEHPGNGALRSCLKNEYMAHSAIVLAFGKYENRVKSGVYVPRVTTLISTESSFWNEQKFPNGYQEKTVVVKMERIFPLPKVVRNALLSQFHPEANDYPLLQNVLNVPANKHCLARTYLGKQNWTFTENSFSLRNIPLCLDAMENLGLDLLGLARSMGKAFAILQWGAGYDGDDVEFVLGTRLHKNEEEDSGVEKRKVWLCLLDFGQCESIDMAEEAPLVYQKMHGAMITGDNAWFIPHYQKSPGEFKAFRNAYIQAGNVILKEKGWLGRFSMEDFMNEYELYAEDLLS